MTDTKQERLKAVLATYGADPARWPADERQALAALLDRSSGEYREAVAVDRLLDLASRPVSPSGAEGRLLSKAHGIRPRPARRLLPWTAALPLAASFLLGIYLGTAGTIDAWLPSTFVTDEAEESDVDILAEDNFI